MKLPEHIKVRSDVMMGKPCVKGTRVPVYILLQLMAGGETKETILAAYPQLSSADLLDCLRHAAALAAEEVVPAEA